MCRTRSGSRGKQQGRRGWGARSARPKLERSDMCERAARGRRMERERTSGAALSRVLQAVLAWALSRTSETRASGASAVRSSKKRRRPARGRGSRTVAVPSCSFLASIQPCRPLLLPPPPSPPVRPLPSALCAPAERSPSSSSRSPFAPASSPSPRSCALQTATTRTPCTLYDPSHPHDPRTCHRCRSRDPAPLPRLVPRPAPARPLRLPDPRQSPLSPSTSTRRHRPSSSRSSSSSSPRPSRAPTSSTCARRATSSSRTASSPSTTRSRTRPRVRTLSGSSRSLFPHLTSHPRPRCFRSSPMQASPSRPPFRSTTSSRTSRPSPRTRRLPSRPSRRTTSSRWSLARTLTVTPS